MSIIVFGSINIDLIARTPRLPIPGETVIGREFLTAAGGKGANQAVAAARLGSATEMVGRVGGDSFGQEALASLQAAGVKTSGVSVEPTVSTGVALIAVEDTGQNYIIIVSGANAIINETDCERLIPLLPGAAALLLQLEIPVSASLAAARAAKKAGVQVILNPAPARQDIPDELYTLTDIITPNEIEASQLTGIKVNDADSAARAATELRHRGAKIAIIKLGRHGVFCAADKESFFLPAFPVKAVDTTAAGDAFNGALAVAIASGESLRRAVVWGAAAGALCATKVGAQPAMPNRQAFDTFLGLK